MHEGTPGSLSFLFCAAEVSGWGSHLLTAYLWLAQGVLMAFRAVASHLPVNALRPHLLVPFDPKPGPHHIR